jgi:diaminopimelate decarboxylase
MREQAPSIEDYLDTVVAAAREHLPADARLLIEPGRSLVARAGVTLYETLTVKHTGRDFVR